ncbi:DUF3081 family protein [Corallincola platygyrae]|uniref:DUF3081 family protein n=1 Tax=Corallincola platygyrae TaxID=1193278 RepID=A0ABW4XKU0_9GAMM
MKNELDIHLCLRAFEKIRQLGAKREGAMMDVYDYQGLSASSGYDGYDITVSNRDVSATIHFHNSYDLDYHGQDKLDTFISQLNRLDRIDVSDSASRV